MTFLSRTRSIAVLSGLAFSLLAGAVPALAEDAAPEGGALGGALSAGLNKAAPKELQGASDLNTIIASLISSVIGFLGVVLFVYLLYGGFIYMTAGGDTSKVKEATSIIRNAIVGLVIIALAYAIATFVITQLGTATGAPAPT